VPYYRDTYPEPSKDEEKSNLESMVKGLEGELKAIKERLQELSKEKEEVP
jgi:predicted nuclease with TOPRIM domain